MTKSATTKAVVVGIDGSKAALRAALWAVDEAVSRDVPLRLLYAIEQADTSRESAESAVRQARTAMEAAGKPVEVETDVVRGTAVGSLIRASASAAMVCVGAVGLRHFQPGRVGSTAAAVAMSARCPVAIIRGGDGPAARPAREIVVEVDGSPHNGVLLGAAIEEALLRGADLRVVICRRSVPAETGKAAAGGDRRALARLDRWLARWKRRYPQLRIESIVVHGGIADYLTQHRSVGLVIVGAYEPHRVAELVGPVGSAILHDIDCSLLIVSRQHL